MAPEFAACSRRGLDARGPDGLGGLEESRELVLRRDVVVLGSREMGEETLDLETSVLHAARERGAVSGGHTPTRCIPVSIFICTARNHERPPRGDRGRRPNTAWA